MPLRALLDGKDFYYSELTEVHRKSNFICPHCESRVIPVLPKLEGRIKHFRHRDKECPYAYERETQEHLYGKKTLMEISSKLGLKAKLEVKIGEHITDVLLEGEQPLAIEFQCSPCNSTEILERAETYKKQGIATFWILGKNFFKDLQKKTRKKIEQEIEKLHSTVYFVDNKFILVRINRGTGDRRLVEDFDINWHLLNFTKTKLTEEKPELIFKWMIDEEKKESVRNKVVEPSGSPSESHRPHVVSESWLSLRGDKHRREFRPHVKYQTRPHVKYQTYRPIEPPKTVASNPVSDVPKAAEENFIKPVYSVLKVHFNEPCGECGKNSCKYSVTFSKTPSKYGDRKCEACFNRLKQTFPRAKL